VLDRKIKMSQEEEHYQTFVNLGLTYLQAKVYVTLLRLGDVGAEVRKIASVSAIARQDVYRILPTLQKMGLVEKVVAIPTIYRPISLEEGISKLLKKRTEEYQDVKKKAKFLMENFVAPEVEPKDDSSQFVITSERNLFMKRVREDIAKTESSIDIIYGDGKLRTIIFHTFDEFQKASARGVKIRAITHKTEEEPLGKNLQILSSKATFDLRFINKNIPVGLVIFDNKEANIRTMHTIVPSLWTNNRNVVRLSKFYFDCLWEM
jgi:sugar-specific transcriptional regulator TrmB